MKTSINKTNNKKEIIYDELNKDNLKEEYNINKEKEFSSNYNSSSSISSDTVITFDFNHTNINPDDEEDGDGDNKKAYDNKNIILKNKKNNIKKIIKLIPIQKIKKE